jgi:hypothetical protein
MEPVIISVGNRDRFAIESQITTAYERIGWLALGYFNIFINGYRYGRHFSDSTLLGCSVDEIDNRLKNRGEHIVDFGSEPDAGKIAAAYRKAIYSPNGDDDIYFGRCRSDFTDFVGSSKLTWAPDGDEAFDDGSYVLQFDVADHVRLIAFKSEGYGYNAATLNDVWLDAETYYNLLQEWRSQFEHIWMSLPKVHVKIETSR